MQRTLESTDSAQVSLCVNPQGDAAVFVTGGSGPRVADLTRLATAFAERGLRLLGVSSSPHRAPAVCTTGTRTAVVGSGSLLDAVMSLVAERESPVAA